MAPVLDGRHTIRAMHEAIWIKALHLLSPLVAHGNHLKICGSSHGLAMNQYKPQSFVG